MQNINQILKASNLSINELLIQNMDKDLTLKDFLVFLKLLNTSCECFDCSKMAKTLGLTEEDVMTSFNNLIIKGIIEYKPVKENGRIKEVILSGVKSFRYIDRVLFDWQEKGYRSMNDVEISKKKNTKAPEKINQDNNSNEEYFDYDWLNDDDE